MENNKDFARFTMQLNSDNPLHARAVDILNRQKSRGKARYTANDIVHYESCDITSDIIITTTLDEDAIEAVVERVLQKRSDLSSNTPLSVHLSEDGEQRHPLAHSTEQLILADTIEDLDGESLRNIADALEMFKKK